MELLIAILFVCTALLLALTFVLRGMIMDNLDLIKRIGYALQERERELQQLRSQVATQAEQIKTQGAEFEAFLKMLGMILGVLPKK